jgi:Uma2 family endonuclease
MSTTSPAPELDPEVIPNLDELITQDDAPVDRIFTEKQQRLLVEPLYSSWPGPGEGRTFLALANVGVFYNVKQPALVPDALLSLDVVTPEDLHVKEGHSYYLWLMGKPPDVVIEIVSDRRGEEESEKQRAYARLRVPFYVIFDPENILGGGALRVLELRRRRYEPIEPGEIPDIGLGLTLWEGPFEGHHDTWLRWCGPQAQVILTGAERANRLAAQLKGLNIEPEA